MEFKGTNYYMIKASNERILQAEDYGYGNFGSSTTNININFDTLGMNMALMGANMALMANGQYELELEKQKKEIELMDSQIQQNRFNTLRDCIQMGMSDGEISKITGFAETQIYNYRMSFK